jgi:L-fucose isomerase
MRKTKVGIVTFSDGRDYIHQSLEELNWRYQRKLAAALEATGEVEVVPAEGMVTVPEGYPVKRFTPFWKDLGKEWS